MNQIIQIFKYKLRIFLNYNNQIFSNKQFLIQSIIGTLIFLLFGLGIYFFTKGVLRYVLEEIHIGQFLLHRFISILLFVFFISITAGNIIVAYSMLFKSNEVFHLITKPIKHEKLFFIRMIESILYSSPTFLLIGFAVLIAYGVYFKLEIYYYPISIIFIFIPFVFSAALIGVIILIFLLLLTDKIGLHLTIFSIVSFYLITIYSFFKIINPKNLVTEVMKYYPHFDFNFSFLIHPINYFLPNHWFTESLFYLNKVNLEFSFKYILLIDLLFIFLIICATFIGNKFFYKSFLIALELKARKQKEDLKKVSSSYKKIFLDFRSKSIFSAQIDSLLKKEFHQFFRETAQWIHLGVISFLIIIFISSISRIDVIKTFPFLQTVTYLTIFIFNSFLISSMCLRFVYPVLSIEAQAFWKIKSAPVKPITLIKAKLLPLLIIILTIAEILNYFSHLSIHLGNVLKIYSSVNILSISLTLVALNFGFGSYFVTFDEKSPVKIASSRGATISFLFNMIYLIFLIIVLIIPINNYFENKSYLFSNLHINFIISSLILLTVAVLVTIISIRLGIKAISSDINNI